MSLTLGERFGDRGLPFTSDGYSRRNPRYEYARNAAYANDALVPRSSHSIELSRLNQLQNSIDIEHRRLTRLFAKLRSDYATRHMYPRNYQPYPEYNDWLQRNLEAQLANSQIIPDQEYAEIHPKRRPEGSVPYDLGGVRTLMDLRHCDDRQLQRILHAYGLPDPVAYDTNSTNSYPPALRRSRNFCHVRHCEDCVLTEEDLYSYSSLGRLYGTLLERDSYYDRFSGSGYYRSAYGRDDIKRRLRLIELLTFLGAYRVADYEVMMLNVTYRGG